MSGGNAINGHPGDRRALSDVVPRVGTWRSLVAYLNGVQGVVGSNPTVPTTDLKGLSSWRRNGPFSSIAYRQPKAFAETGFLSVRGASLGVTVPSWNRDSRRLQAALVAKAVRAPRRGTDPRRGPIPRNAYSMSLSGTTMCRSSPRTIGFVTSEYGPRTPSTVVVRGRTPARARRDDSATAIPSSVPAMLEGKVISECMDRHRHQEW